MDYLASDDYSPTPEVPEQSITPSEASESIDHPQGELLEPLEHLKDGKYYWEFVTLSVEGCLFMVPKFHFMRYGSQFNWILKNTDEGIPYELNGIEKADFRALLKCLYPLHRPDQSEITADEWVSILKLASKWMMLDIREAAIGSLDCQPWLQKISLARTYGVIAWLRDGYSDYVRREQSLSVEDVQGLGMETALRVIKLREQRNRERFQQEVHEYSSSRALESYNSFIASCRDAVDKELSEELVGADAVRGADAVERVLWARSRNNVESLKLAYVDLVEREDSISLDEASKLGLETTTRLCRARERSLRSYPGYYSGFSIDIVSIFREEMDMIADISMMYAPKCGTRDGSQTKRSSTKEGKKKRKIRV